jgi:RNA polymerase sigma factor (sigma-70 family)
MGIDYFNLQEKVYILDKFKKFELPRELYVKATGLSKVLPHNRFHKGWFGLFHIRGDKQPFTRQEIESVLNETYVDAVINWRMLYDEDKVDFDGYLYRAFYKSIAKYFDGYVKAQRIKPLSEKLEEELEGREIDPVDRLVRDEFNWSRFDFRMLNKRELEIVCFYYLGDKSHDDIAQIYCLSVANVRKIKQRILEKLAKSDINKALYQSELN